MLSFDLWSKWLLSLTPINCRFFLKRFPFCFNLFAVPPCLAVVIQPCIEWILIKKDLYTISFIPCINIPTWIAQNLETCIDNIFYNKIISDSIAGNITTGISDHLIQFLIEPSTFSNKNEKGNIAYCCCKHFNEENI